MGHLELSLAFSGIKSPSVIPSGNGVMAPGCTERVSKGKFVVEGYFLSSFGLRCPRLANVPHSVSLGGLGIF